MSKKVGYIIAVAGLAALNENDYYMNNCRIIEENREFTKVELEGLGFRVLPSKANFIFAESDDIDGGTLYEKLKQRGVLVRHFSQNRISDYVRITIGSVEEMNILVENIKEILEESL